MVKGYHMYNGYKEIEIEEINVYGNIEWKFKFIVDGMLYNERITDDKSRYIEYLEKEYYFEED